MTSNDAGPSQSHRSTQRTSNGHSHTQRKNRPSQMDLEEIFEKQDIEDIKKTTRAYRALQTAADEMRMDIKSIQPEQLMSSLQRQNKLFRDVVDPGVAALDAKLIQTTTETAAGLARAMRLDTNAFDIDEFLIRIRKRLNFDMETQDAAEAEAEDADELEEDSYENTRKRQRMGRNELSAWEKIGWLAAGLTRRVPGVEFMNGPLSVQHKKRVIARREKAKPLAPQVRAQIVEPTGEKNKNDTVSNVREVGKILDKLDPKREGYNIFKLLVNPQSFGQTVENFFGVSFLIKDGKAGIRVEDDGEIIIYACDPYNPEEEGDEPPPLHQHIMELDMEVWRTAIEIFNITESAIPHREETRAAPTAAGTWYT